MTKTLTPDICVIGAGSGGLSVAAAAAAFGVDVVLIEKGAMGGDCLNTGCVPSKALIAAAKSANTMRTSDRFGIASVEPKISPAKVHKHIHDVIATIAPHDSVERFEGLGVTVIQATARFQDADTVIAGDTQIKARRFVIATGSKPFIPPIKGIDDVPFFTNETIFDNKKTLEHLIIIGGGPIGMELAQAHHRLGSKVTVIEAFKAMGKDDPELSAIVLNALRDEGIEILENTPVVELSRKGRSGISVTVEVDGKPKKLEGTHLLVAAGRSPTIEGLGLSEAGIETTSKGIETGANLRTSNKKVYAIGDVAGGPQFTHVAGYYAGLVIRSILFRMNAKTNYNALPWVTFTDPELAHVGMTEVQAIEQYGDVKVLRWNYQDNDRAVAERKTDGLIKMIARKNGLIVGVSIVGAGAGEMINMWTLAITRKTKLKHVAGYISPYPSMSEIGKRAAVGSFAELAKNKFLRFVIRQLARLG